MSVHVTQPAPVKPRTREQRRRLRLLRNPDALHRLIAEGRTCRQIADWVGCNRSSVRDALTRHGIDPRRGLPHEPARA